MRAVSTGTAARHRFRAPHDLTRGLLPVLQTRDLLLDVRDARRRLERSEDVLCPSQQAYRLGRVSCARDRIGEPDQRA